MRSKFKWTGLVFLLVAVGALAVATAQSATSAKKLNIVVVSNSQLDSFQLQLGCGGEAAGKALGANVKWQAPSQTDPIKQTAIVDALVAKHVDAIVIAASDKVALVAPLQRAKKAGIKIIMIDSSVAKPVYDAYVSSNNVVAAQQAADLMAKYTNGQGPILIEDAKAAVSTLDQRRDGFIAQAKAKYPNMEIIPVGYNDLSAAKAAADVDAALSAHPDLKGIYSLEPVSSIPVTAEIARLGKKSQVTLVNFDADPTEVADLKAGRSDALIVQRAFQIGYEGVKTAIADLKGKPYKKRQYVGIVIATQANMNNAAVAKNLSAKGCKP